VSDDLDRPALRATLVQLRSRVDAHFDAAVARTPAAFACRAGCDACCHQRFGVFAIEAAPLRDALARLARESPELRSRIRAQAREQQDPAVPDRCPMLVDGRCAVYAERPMICRSHGLPIAVVDPEPRIDHCPLNFTAEAPPPASTLRLAAVNQPLAVLAALWKKAGAPGDIDGDLADDRIPLADLALAPDRD
jgi:Fe-S-cluster containining protein